MELVLARVPQVRWGGGRPEAGTRPQPEHRLRRELLKVRQLHLLWRRLAQLPIPKASRSPIPTRTTFTSAHISIAILIVPSIDTVYLYIYENYTYLVFMGYYLLYTVNLCSVYNCIRYSTVYCTSKTTVGRQVFPRANCSGGAVRA